MLGSNDFKDFKENEILFATSGSNSSSTYIFKLNGLKGYKEYIVESNKYRPESGDKSFNWCNFIIRKSTPLEKAWLQECIKQGEFVPLDKIKVNNNYRLWKLKITT